MTETTTRRHLSSLRMGAEPDERDLTTDLLTTVSGRVLSPTGREFEDAMTRIDPGRIHRPTVMVIADDAADVPKVLHIAAQHGVPVTVIGTGHSAVEAVRSGVLLTFRGPPSVDIDPITRIARVDAGASWRDVLAAAGGTGSGPICGSAPDVGVIGFLLGGGIGPVGRTYGYGSDQVRGFQVVLPSGSVVDVDHQHHRDLFWALRGGKTNSGVVVLSALIELPPITEIYGGGLYFGEEDIEAVLRAYQALVNSDVPDELTASIAILRLPELPDLPPAISGRTVAHLRVGYVGNPGEAERLLQPLRQAATPVLGTIGPMPYAELGRIHNDPTKLSAHAGGGLLLNTFTGGTVDELLRSAGPDVTTPLAIVEVRHLGGALSRSTATPDAVGGRAAAFGVWVSSPPLTPPGAVHGLQQDSAVAAIRTVLDGLTPWSTGGTQPNFTGSANTDSEIAAGWSGLARQRLNSIARRYDPAGVLCGGRPRS